MNPRSTGATRRPSTLSRRRPAPRLLGPRLHRAAGRRDPDHGRLPARLRAWSWPGRVRRSPFSAPSPAGAVAGRSLLALLVMVAQPHRPGTSTARAPTSSSGTATTSPPTSWPRCWRRSAATCSLPRLPRALRAGAARHAGLPAGHRLAALRPQSRYRIADEFSRAVLEERAARRHLVATDDNILFVLIYLTHGGGLRPDVDLILQGVGGADLPPLHFDPDTRSALLHPPPQLAPATARDRARSASSSARWRAGSRRPRRTSRSAGSTARTTRACPRTT